MSWWFNESIAKTPDGTILLASFEADDTTVFPNVIQYKIDPSTHQPTTEIDYTIARGSSLYCLSNSKTYKLNSSGQWVEQHDGSGGASSADQISYDNTTSGMTATNVQDALDELDTADDTLQGQITTLSTTVDGKTTVAAIYGLPPTTIAPEEGTTESLNNYTTPGVYTVPTATAAGRITESPVTTRGYRMEVKQYRSGSYYRQTIMPWGEANAIYTRSRQGGTNWTAWYKFEATQVQTVQSVNSPMSLNLGRNDLNESLDSNFDLLDSIPEEEESE